MRKMKSGGVKGKLLFVIVLAAAAFAAAGVGFPKEATDSETVVMPVFEDVTDENRVYIETVYTEGYMFPGGNGDFGAGSYMTASETAFVALRLYESRSSLPPSFDTYYTMQDAYIDKALEYGIWPEISASGEQPITAEDAAAVLAQFAEDATGAGITQLKSLDGYAYAGSILKLYDLGITTGKNAAEAFSPQRLLTRGEMAELVTKLIKPETRMSISLPDYSAMQEKLTSMMSGYDGDWSLFFEDYETGAAFSVNSHQVFSASLIKLFVIQTVYQRIADGLMSDSDGLEEQLRRMITYSDNDAWYNVTRRISGGTHSAGMAVVTRTAAAAGFADTGTFYLDHPGNYNYTSVNDCGRYLEMVLDGELVSQEYSARVLELLKQQQILHKIPAGVPEGVQTANKTGELDYMQGDAAVVYAPSGTYILVVIADDLVNTGIAPEQIRDISRYVYDFLNN